ncbi:MAG TPA: hypothetical protein VKA34_07535 [Balneolales bacterium]|nr:hypothetical protein [Balneolales bacterium]
MALSVIGFLIGRDVLGFKTTVCNQSQRFVWILNQVQEDVVFVSKCCLKVNYPGLFTKKFCRDQGEFKNVHETYIGTLIKHF